MAHSTDKGRVPHTNNDISISLTELARRWDVSEGGLKQEIRDQELTCAQFNKEELKRKNAQRLKEYQKNENRKRDKWGERARRWRSGPFEEWSMNDFLNKAPCRLDALRFRLERDIWPVEERIPERKAAAWEHYQAKTGEPEQDRTGKGNPFFIKAKPGTRWEQVSFELLTNRERIQVRVNGRLEYTTFKQLGLTKSKEDKLSTLGSLFEALPEIQEQNLSLPIDSKKSISRLRNLLRKTFPGIKGDPFPTKEGYLPAFRVTKNEQYDV